MLDALGQPIDERGALPQGEPPSTSTPRAQGDAPRRVQVAVRTGVKPSTPSRRSARAAHRHFRGLGRRQIDAARHDGARAAFDAVVICLVGERGREVREFLDDVLGRTSANVVVVVATGDESPMMRRLAPLAATTIAESYFRDPASRCCSSSIPSRATPTRCARSRWPLASRRSRMAIRRACSPTFRGCSSAPVRAIDGRGIDHRRSFRSSSTATITTTRSPIACAARSTAISCSTARSPNRAAIRRSTFSNPSRVSPIASGARKSATLSQRRERWSSRFEDTRDLRLLGGYQPGGDASLDRAVALTPTIYQALQQAPDSPAKTGVIRELGTILGARA